MHYFFLLSYSFLNILDHDLLFHCQNCLYQWENPGFTVVWGRSWRKQSLAAVILKSEKGTEPQNLENTLENLSQRNPKSAV